MHPEKNQHSREHSGVPIRRSNNGMRTLRTCIISPWWGDITFAGGHLTRFRARGEAGVSDRPPIRTHSFLFLFFYEERCIYIRRREYVIWPPRVTLSRRKIRQRREGERERERAVAGGAPSTYSKHFATTATTPNSNATGTNALAVSASPSANVAVVVVVDFLVVDVAAVAGDRDRWRRSGAHGADGRGVVVSERWVQFSAKSARRLRSYGRRRRRLGVGWIYFMWGTT